MKGKTTKKKGEVIIGDKVIDVPIQIILRNQELELAIDVMYICGVAFLTNIDLSIQFRAAIALRNTKAPELHRGIAAVIAHYNKAHYGVKRIRVDNEFESSKQELETLLQIAVNSCNPDEHVPQAERNNRVIEEGVRTALHRLHFRVIPKAMIRHLVMRVTQTKNLFIPKGGVSQVLSPHMLVNNKRVNATKHCKYEFGTYVQATQKHEPRNDASARTLDAIYLRVCTERLQLGHYVMCLSTGRVVIRSQIACVLPMTQRVIDIVEAMAEKQGIKEYKATDRNKKPFLDLDLAGVEDESDDESDEEYEEENDDSSQDSDDNIGDLEKDEV